MNKGYKPSYRLLWWPPGGKGFRLGAVRPFLGEIKEIGTKLVDAGGALQVLAVEGFDVRWSYPAIDHNEGSR